MASGSFELSEVPHDTIVVPLLFSLQAIHQPLDIASTFFQETFTGLVDLVYERVFRIGVFHAVSSRIRITLPASQ
jgi:hypothetical protein